MGSTPSIEAVLLPLAARTTNTVLPDIPTSRKEMLEINTVCTASSSGSVAILVEGRDALGNYFTVISGTAVVAPGAQVIRVGRALTAAGGTIANDQVPGWIRVTATHANSNSITYSVCLNLM